MIVNVYEYFKKHPSFNKLVGSDFLFVEYKCPINIEEFQLWTKSHLITYVINGKKDWVTPKKTYALQAGDALFVRRGVYTTRQYLQEDYCVMLFFISDDFINRFISENDIIKNKKTCKSDHDFIYEINRDDSFKSLMESMFHYLKQGEKIPKSLIKIKFTELLYNIVLNNRNKNLLDFFNSIGQNSKVDIEDVMLENFRFNLKLEEFSILCGRSLSTFKRDFKNKFNTTPARWLTTKRLEYSKKLLLSTELNINEICYQSGFKNNSHFINAFKSKFGLPPNQFKIKQFEG
jgi:AraC-like DNA-binding protein